VLLLVLAILGLSYILGERHRRAVPDDPYESGILVTGSARVRLSAQFYLIAMLFVIFDLEAVFLVTYAVAFRDLGWTGYFEVLVFVGILLVALVYLWREGALEWVSRSSAKSGGE